MDAKLACKSMSWVCFVIAMGLVCFKHSSGANWYYWGVLFALFCADVLNGVK